MPELTALALAIAASPFGIVPAVLLLFTARPRVTAGAFAGGWAGGVLAPAVSAALLAGTLPLGGDRPTWLSWAKVVAGLILLLLALRQWLERHASKQPAWLDAVAGATPPTAARLGVLLSAANPKVAMLALAAGIQTGRAEPGALAGLLVLAGFTTLASTSVVAPVLLHVILGERALPPLQAAREWLTRHHGPVVALVLGVMGALLVVDGLAGV